jgi:hypothetical protein
MTTRIATATCALLVGILAGTAVERLASKVNPNEAEAEPLPVAVDPPEAPPVSPAPTGNGDLPYILPSDNKEILRLWDAHGAAIERHAKSLDGLRVLMPVTAQFDFGYGGRPSEGPSVMWLLSGERRYQFPLKPQFYPRPMFSNGPGGRRPMGIAGEGLFAPQRRGILGR